MKNKIKKMSEKEFEFITGILEQMIAILNRETALLEHHKLAEYNLLTEEKMGIAEQLEAFQNKWGTVPIEIENKNEEKKTLYEGLREKFETAFRKNMITLMAAEKVAKVITESIHDIASRDRDNPVGYGIKNGQLLSSQKLRANDSAIPLKLNMCF